MLSDAHTLYTETQKGGLCLYLAYNWDTFPVMPISEEQVHRDRIVKTLDTRLLPHPDSRFQDVHFML